MIDNPSEAQDNTRPLVEPYCTRTWKLLQTSALIMLHFYKRMCANSSRIVVDVHRKRKFPQASPQSDHIIDDIALTFDDLLLFLVQKHKPL